MTPPQVATESPKPAIGWMAEMAVMLRMLPPPRAIMCGTAPRAMRTTYIRFCSTALAQAASSKLVRSPSGGAPSLLTRMSMPPSGPATVSIDARAVLGAAAVGLDRQHLGAGLRADASRRPRVKAGSRRAVMATLRAFGRQRARDAVADAHAGAADDGDLALQRQGPCQTRPDAGLGEEPLGVLVEHLVEHLRRIAFRAPVA